MAALLAEHVPIETATHALPSTDGTVAAHLASSVGVPHSGIRRGARGLYPSIGKYLRLLPWSEGTLHLGMLDDCFSVHDLAHLKGMVHLGGLGGEVGFVHIVGSGGGRVGSPQEILRRAVFCASKAALLSPSADHLDESRTRWRATLDVDWDGDPLALAQVAYLDTRLRGMLVLRTNCSWFDYAWTIATPQLYAYALRLPRRERQAGMIFDDLISALWPELLRSLNGPAVMQGSVHRRGIRGVIRHAKEVAKRSEMLHVLRGHIRSPRGRGRRRVPVRWCDSTSFGIAMSATGYFRGHPPRQWR